MDFTTICIWFLVATTGILVAYWGKLVSINPLRLWGTRNTDWYIYYFYQSWQQRSERTDDSIRRIADRVEEIHVHQEAAQRDASEFRQRLLEKIRQLEGTVKETGARNFGHDLDALQAIDATRRDQAAIRNQLASAIDYLVRAENRAGGTTTGISQ